ncbi:MAG: hypothetical protein A3J38_01085 [Gammaproteobacteria bacterium RIFCSPHIGHO2_12_FULL_45_9]|nr:MAG: hypothetical protein A3J38_01085 [Gammaproteobacteria bacterium RIFCSPHIGHO2_12_FULL_45_9]
MLPWCNPIPRIDNIPIQAAFDYLSPITHWIQALKFHQALYYARYLADLWYHRWHNMRSTPLPEYIVPIPLHTHRLRSRGFNQTLLLAQRLKKRLSIPINTTLLTKIDHTQAQATLTADARKQNLTHAFTVSTDVMPAHVTLLDDVVTTGATMQAARHTLLTAGVQTVEIWCMAYTPPHRVQIP